MWLVSRFSLIAGIIEWPSEDEAPPDDARDLVTRLLEQDPIVRLGTAGECPERTLMYVSSFVQGSCVFDVIVSLSPQVHTR